VTVSLPYGGTVINELDTVYKIKIIRTLFRIPKETYFLQFLELMEEMLDID